jgi:transposase
MSHWRRQLKRRHNRTARRWEQREEERRITEAIHAKWDRQYQRVMKWIADNPAPAAKDPTP